MKTLSDNMIKHLKMTFIFLLIISSASGANVVSRKLGYSTLSLQILMIILLIAIVGIYGWLSVRRFNAKLFHASLMGALLSLGSHWTLPLFHKGFEIVQLLLINTIIFIAITFIGALLAVIVKRILIPKNQ